MGRRSRLGWQVLALLAVVIPHAAASAQERRKIELVPLVAHAGQILAATFSPDGSLVLTGGDDTTLRLWDAASGRPIRTFAGHAGPVCAVAFSFNGARALSGSLDGTVRLWDAASGRLVQTFQHANSLPGSITAVAFSADGTRVVSGSGYEGELKLWDAATGKLLRTFDHGHPRRSLNAVAFSPDGTRLMSSGARTAKLWDAAAGRLLQTFGDGTDDVSFTFAFSPDGARLAVGAANSLTLWDTARGTLIRALEDLPNSNSPDFVAFSQDGALILASIQGYDGGLMFWDVGNGRLVRALRGFSAIAVSPNGAHALRGPFSTELWDVMRWRKIRALAEEQPIASVAVSPGGDQVLAGIRTDRGVRLPDTIRLWDAATGRLVSTRSLNRDAGEIFAFTFLPDGVRAISRDCCKWIISDALTGRLILGFEADATDKRAPMALSADGTRLIGVIRGGTIKLWDAATGKAIRTFEDSAAHVDAVALSPDGARVVSGGIGQMGKIWDASSGQIVATFQPRQREITSALAFSPDGGRVLAAGRIMELWEAATGRRIRTWSGHTGLVREVVFSPDGTRVLSHGGTDFMVNVGDTTLKLWDTATGRLLHAIEGHLAGISSVVAIPDRARSIAFSPDGRRIFGGGFDGAIRIWDPDSGGLLATLLAAKSGEWLTVTPEGFFDTSTRAAATDMLSVVRGLQAFGIDERSYQVLHRPDLVREKLAGDRDGKVTAAAAELEAKLQLN